MECALVEMKMKMLFSITMVTAWLLIHGENVYHTAQNFDE